MQPYLGISFILLVCLTVIVVVFGNFSKRVYPFILYGIAAGMVLMTSLAGPYLIGCDIHLEYFFAQLRAGKDVLTPAYNISQGTSVIWYVTDNIWVFKLVYPLLFALVPPILYFVFKKFLEEKQAFMAAFFFIVFPSFFMELPGIARQMTAEVILVALIYLLYVSKFKYRWIPLIICGALLPMFHYATGTVALLLIGGGILWSKQKKMVLAVLATILIASCIYFPLAENGAVYIKYAYLYNNWIAVSLHLPKIPAPEMDQPRYPSPEYAEYPINITPQQGVSFMDRYEELILGGLGFDFLKTTTAGKIFRLLQWIIAALILVGLWRMRKNKTYWAFAAGSLTIIILLVIPGFSALLNATRFIHLSLFMLAPLIAVALKPKYLLMVLIPYFLFTSGFVFEVIKQPNIEQITIPYNVGLSNYRMDLGASITEDDIKVRDYIYENKLFPIFSDINAADLMGERTGWRNDLNIALTRKPTPAKMGYVFVRSQNVRDGTFTIWFGVGRRIYIDPEEHYGINWNENIVYQSGESRVIWVP
jgi:uncharacterized membrane protein